MTAMEDHLYYCSVDFKAAADGGFDVDVARLPGCVTWGTTYEEAISKAREAIEGYLETLIKLGKPIPQGANNFELGHLVLGVTPDIRS